MIRICYSCISVVRQAFCLRVDYALGYVRDLIKELFDDDVVCSCLI